MINNKPELMEKDFISEKGLKKSSKPTFQYLLLVIAVIALTWWWVSFKQNWIASNNQEFGKVTNREFSLFLWQNPEYTRRLAYEKDHHLTQFSKDGGVHIVKNHAEDIVEAPPSLVYNYYYWKKFAGDIDFSREIERDFFYSFLESCPEWLPENWNNAPKSYSKISESLLQLSSKEFKELQQTLPDNLRQAFFGWLNYYHEGNLINAVAPSYEEVQSFLKEHPNLKRNIWKNLLLEQAPNYLQSALDSSIDKEKLYPQGEMTSLFKLLYFNIKDS
jgi:hypothetical protein